MSEPQFEVDDLIILLLGAPTKSPDLNDRISGITRLEKLIFILDRETEIGKLLTEKPEFVPHNFGPFSQKVYQAIDTLAYADLVIDSARLDSSDEEAWESRQYIDDAIDQRYISRQISLTERGTRYYSALSNELGPAIVESVSSIKEQFGNLPLTQLVRYVYRRHPDQIERSTIRDRILGTEK